MFTRFIIYNIELYKKFVLHISPSYNTSIQFIHDKR